MMPLKLSDSPIVYYVSGRSHKEWVLFLHAAFVDHNMFQAQADFSKTNIMCYWLIPSATVSQQIPKKATV